MPKLSPPAVLSWNVRTYCPSEARSTTTSRPLLFIAYTLSRYLLAPPTVVPMLYDHTSLVDGHAFLRT